MALFTPSAAAWWTAHACTAGGGEVGGWGVVGCGTQGAVWGKGTQAWLSDLEGILGAERGVN